MSQDNQVRTGLIKRLRGSATGLEGSVSVEGRQMRANFLDAAEYIEVQTNFITELKEKVGYLSKNNAQMRARIAAGMRELDPPMTASDILSRNEEVKEASQDGADNLFMSLIENFLRDVKLNKEVPCSCARCRAR